MRDDRGSYRYDVFRTEQAFQELLVGLTQPASPRQHVLSIGTFLAELGPFTTRFEPYLLELAHRIVQMVDALTPEGLDPEAFEGLAGQADRMAEAVPLLASDPLFDSARARLRWASAILYAYTGEIENTIRLLSQRDDKTTSPAWDDGIPDGPPLVRLQETCRIARANNDSSAPELEHLLLRWNERLKLSVHETWIPVVERSVVNETERRPLPSLRRMYVELADSTTPADHIQTDVAVFGATAANGLQLHIPASVVRRMLARRFPMVGSRYFSVHVRFDSAFALHEGASANFSIAALFFCSVLDKTERRERYRLTPGTILTGDLESSGTVLDVDPDLLALKVKAAFFSWCERLVVPAGQRKAALDVLNDLARRFPRRPLDIIGVERFEDLLFDRRLTELVHDRWPRYLVRWVWRRKLQIGGPLVSLALAVALGLALYGPIDRNPVDYDTRGEWLLVKNRDGDVIKRVYAGFIDQLRPKLGPAYLNPVSFYDVDGDGVNEVFWAELPSAIPTGTSKIHCQSINADHPRWSLPMEVSFQLPRQSPLSIKQLQVLSLVVGDFDRDGTVDLVLIANSTDSYPGVAFKLDARTGREQARYVHSGALSNLRTVDLNRDGVMEILLGGTNNAYREAVLIVLDPGNMQGVGPTRGDYAIDGYSPARELFYVRIPRTKVGNALRFESPRGVLGGCRVTYNPFLIIANVVDAADKHDTYGYYLFLNEHLEPTGINTQDYYDLKALRIQEEGRIDRVPDYTYFQAFFKTFNYWNGTSWQHEPVNNGPISYPTESRQQIAVRKSIARSGS